MIRAAVQTTEPTAVAALDPTVLALLSIFGGVVVTVVAGLIGAAIQARREHSRWVRERRYEAFVRTLAALDNLGDHVSGMKDADAFSRLRLDLQGDAEAQRRYFIEQSERLLREVSEALTPLRVLGPDRVRDAFSRYGVAVKAWDADGRAEALKDATLEMRKVLDLKT